MLRIVLKGGLKKVPVVGFAMQSLGYLFLERDWAKDEVHMEGMLECYQNGDGVQLLIFPEGTDLSESNLAKSHAFSKKQNKPLLHNVLIPRSKGLAFITEKMRGSVDALYDITLGFPDKVPQNESTIFNSDWPAEIHIHTRRIELSSLPKDEAGMEEWTLKTFEAKEKSLEAFKSKQAFEGAAVQYEDPAAMNPIVLAFWGVSCLSFFWYLLTSSIFRWWCFLALIAQFVVTKMGGVDGYEIDLNKKSLAAATADVKKQK